MEPVDFYSLALLEEARQEILDLWGEVLPMPFICAGLLLEEVDWRIREIAPQADFASSDRDQAAALEVVQAYLF